MCFGPVASFTAGAGLAVIGTASLKEARSKKEVFLAAFPFFFAVQQLIEGVLWLTLRHGGWFEPFQQKLAMAFLIFAQFFWPIFSPLAVYLIEPDEKRKKEMLALLFFGVCVSFYLLYYILKGPVEVFAAHYSLRYWTSGNKPYWLIAPYLGATFVPYILSSHKPLEVLGVINILLCGAAYYFYHTAFQSVWCFYAAIVSSCIFFFLRWLRRQQPMPYGSSLST